MTNTRPIEGKLVRSYSTRFERDEEPISEGGVWLNGRKDGIDWCDVVVRDGHAFGEVSRMNSAERRAEQAFGGATASADVVEGDYEDPAAVLGGAWGRNQSARATVYSVNPADDYFQEVEIRLRSSVAAHWCDGYEVFWRCSQSEVAYAEIVRWNGKIGYFTSLARRMGSEFGVKHAHDRRGDDRGQRDPELYQRGRGPVGDRRRLPGRRSGGWASTSSSAIPTSTTASRRSRSIPTTDAAEGALDAWRGRLQWFR